jgi:hypothetical protein
MRIAVNSDETPSKFKQKRSITADKTTDSL